MTPERQLMDTLAAAHNHMRKYVEHSYPTRTANTPIPEVAAQYATHYRAVCDAWDALNAYWQEQHDNEC